MNRFSILLIATVTACNYSPETDESEVLTAEQASTAETISVPSGSMISRSLYVMAGYRYTFCINTTVGNADIYGKTGSAPTKTNYQAPYISTNIGTTKADCIWFTATASATFYIGIYGQYSGASTAKYWYVGTPQNNVPSGLSKALTWPLGNYKNQVNWWSEFNSPWGNPIAVNAPFFPGYTNIVHTGMDIYAPPTTTEVKAACSGTIKKAGSLGGNWGYFVSQECTINGTTISIAYNHINSAGRPADNTWAVEGSKIGTIYDISETLEPGEGDHLHFAICKGTYASCLPQSGATTQTNFPGNFINPWITTNPGLFK